jgi:hypothetical protein
VLISCTAEVVLPETLSPHTAVELRLPSAPDHNAPDLGSADRKRFYLRGVGPSRWLLVVVSYEQKPARIISVFANRKDPKTWSV